MQTQELHALSDEYIYELMAWFNNREQLLQWSGPNFEYPFDFSTFKRDLRSDKLQSFTMLASKSRLQAFGQYYLRLGRCHLGRLIVNPKDRGKGIAGQLINALLNQGMKALNVDSGSLFVLSDNTSAIKAYTKMGFVIKPYPEQMPLDHCLYMVCQP